MASRVRILAAIALVGLVSACAPTLGPPPPPRFSPPPNPEAFSTNDFAWSQPPGKGVLTGRVTYVQGATRYSCAGASVILTPETPWSRRRMQVLYKSDLRSALPTDEVRARAPQAPAGDADPYIRRAVCDAADHFSFTGLADGAWYVITIAKPAGGSGASVALMRRVVTKGPRVVNADL